MIPVNLLTPSHLVFKCVQNPLGEEDKKRITTWWDKNYADNPVFFNGDMIACEEYSFKENELKISWYRTNYAHYLQYKNPAPITKPPVILYSCVALVTDENRICLIKMSSSTAAPGSLQLPGGAIETKDAILNEKICRENAIRELQEEVGIMFSPSDLHLNCIITGGQEENIGFVYVNSTPLAEENIHTAFNNLLKKHEDKNIPPEASEILFAKTIYDLEGKDGKIIDYLPFVFQKLLN